jgi:hypothetical protein
MALQSISEEEDLNLMLEFRQTYWEAWVKFCHDNGYKAKVGK